MLKPVFAAVVLASSLSAASVTAATAAEAQTSALNVAVNDTEVNAGALVTVSTVLTVNDSPVQGATVELWKRDFDDPEFVSVSTAQTNASGKASLPALPQTKTHYKWTYAGDDTTTSAVSPWATVKVHTVVTLQLRDDQISSGQRMVAKGMTTPNKAGETVYLYRKTLSGTPKRWLTRTVRSDGTFRFAKSIPSTNRYTLFAVVPAASGNLRGESDAVTLYIGP